MELRWNAGLVVAVSACAVNTRVQPAESVAAPIARADVEVRVTADNRWDQPLVSVEWIDFEDDDRSGVHLPTVKADGFVTCVNGFTRSRGDVHCGRIAPVAAAEFAQMVAATLNAPKPAACGRGPCMVDGVLRIEVHSVTGNLTAEWIVNQTLLEFEGAGGSECKRARLTGAPQRSQRWWDLRPKFAELIATVQAP
ncbi:MAG: hypothetical protein K8S98_18300 [Planctomycetes bacterium]|nr:hypothetical protein [Planctomycetota bacterium]